MLFTRTTRPLWPTPNCWRSSAFAKNPEESPTDRRRSGPLFFGGNRGARGVPIQWRSSLWRAISLETIIRQLGRWRAIHAGECWTKAGCVANIQAQWDRGRTRVFAGGDGRAWLGRCYAKRGVRAIARSWHPTTVPWQRCKAEKNVFREPPCPVRLLTASPASHLRSGTFHVFSHRARTENCVVDRLRHTASLSGKAMAFGMGCVAVCCRPKPI